MAALAFAACRSLARPQLAFVTVATLLLRLPGAEAKVGDIDPAVLEPGYCSSLPDAGESSARAEISVNTMDCARLMEFVYISRSKVWESIDRTRTEAEVDGETAEWRNSLRRVSRVSSLLSAHVHIIAAIASQRTECFSEHVRLLLVVNLRRLKALATSHIKHMWLMAQDGPDEQARLAKDVREWLVQASDLLEADLKTMRTVLQTWQQPAADEARFYSHESDGRFSTMETLRRDTFEEWQMDKGLLQGLVRHVLPVDATVADFGAGSGHYASWLNDTGLVSAFAFDGSPDVELVTKGAVLAADLAKPLELGRTFDWSICLEVAEHIPNEFAPTLLRNLDAHTTKGIVLSWTRPGLPGLASANPQPPKEVLNMVAQHTKFHYDEALTMRLRQASSVAYLAEALTVFVSEPRPADGSCAARDASGACVAGGGAAAAGGCAAEEGLIYAGNDVQMFNDVTSAAACCDLCSSNANCRFWTWSREESHKDLCWIKSTREYRINHEGFISGARRES